MHAAGKLIHWAIPTLLAGAVVVGACGAEPESAARPTTEARLEIVQPAPNQTLGPNFLLNLNLIGAKVVPQQVTGGTLRGTEGHIHVFLDDKLISMVYGTSQELKDVAPGLHILQAEFVAADHAPFANRVVVSATFNVVAPPPTS